MMDEKYITRYRDWSPTPMDQRGTFMDDSDKRLDWAVVMSYMPKIAKLSSESNWNVALKLLQNYPNDFEVLSIGHWATDIELLIVNPNSVAGKIAEEIISTLDDYPILDEMLYSNLQNEAIYDYWKQMSLHDRILECREAGVSIFGARYDDTIPEKVYDQLSESFY